MKAVSKFDGKLSIGCFRGTKAVTVNHHTDQTRVPGFLETLQIDRLAHKRILNQRREGRYDRSGAPLGVVHFLPEGY
jgi:hypothetical protein